MNIYKQNETKGDDFPGINKGRRTSKKIQKSYWEDQLNVNEKFDVYQEQLEKMMSNLGKLWDKQLDRFSVLKHRIQYQRRRHECIYIHTTLDVAKGCEKDLKSIKC